jgi:hypothetical protein
VLKIGDFAKVTGLRRSPQLNGRFIEVMSDLITIEVPEEDGVLREALRHATRFVTNPRETGYFRPENLEPIVDSGAGTYRAIWIHETGNEPPEINGL